MYTLWKIPPIWFIKASITSHIYLFFIYVRENIKFYSFSEFHLYNIVLPIVVTNVTYYHLRPYSFIYSWKLMLFHQPFPASPIPLAVTFPTICFHEFDFLKKIVHVKWYCAVLVFVDLLWINKVSEFIAHTCSCW